jgi:hypothetical protein
MFHVFTRSTSNNVTVPLESNQRFIVNYGDRYRHGEPITSSFVELAVNQVISKRL